MNSKNPTPQSQRTCIVTGGTSGIGEETALELARGGARVVIIGRDRARGEAALQRIRAQRPGGSVEFVTGDLAEQAEVRRLAAELQRSCPRIDVLVNNAGAMFSHRGLTAEGVERTFAVNVVAPFLLTELLADRLRASAPSRVVNLSSDAHRRARFDLDDLQGAKSYSGYRAYCNSKLEILMLTKQFARRFQGSGVTANAVNPGRVNTRFGLGNSGVFVLALRTFMRVLGISPAEAARAVVFVAEAPEGAATSGQYFTRNRQSPTSPTANDDDAAARLWDQCSALTGLAKAA